jgi:SAM-dependent methyltransferase
VTGSIAFDRAAEFYDRSRAISDEAMASTIDLLAGEFAGRGRVLEMGIGTGLLALPLHARGVELAGLDISAPMLHQLISKAGDAAPFPLVLGDATRMPFGDGSFAGAYLRWVLHLIPAWRDVLSEAVRVVRPGGVFLASLGAYDELRREVQERFEALTGVSLTPAGLDWGAVAELDEAMEELGATARSLPPIREVGQESPGHFLEGIEENRFSWTWSVPDEVRRRAANELRAWMRDRFGDLDVVRRTEFDMTWRAYDLPRPPIG